ncbi:TPA: ABC transporter permease [Streptococcus equi subsp. zooepidemicus]|uniref:ABC transporter permease n=1 Tax=Streptococcus equi TaxID=1336 RepID=UPI0024A95FF0|nr:ABC transporter permease [Streptococcus equi]MDI5902929.1 ABC transporter permease [Streptococcus equi subsp. zooepidemicus]MDI5931603.1 ABC transporter permease [Streptococcus equi subsp. zooepidemicus]MDI6030944.1 ABC transporter permease [Streptococcus equi subsp. zooepidemicus]HEL0775639.1 ABC transporter permease [Streptococcus equi subsp. zooepidemicus]HEL0777988.1 ABC transporter permease [Streptococcus equi subsp. zooepidemicus]
MRWRATVICIFVLLLTCLSFGAVKEYGNDIKYPVQAAFSLVASNKDVDKGHVLDRIEALAEQEHIQIYRPYLDHTGKEATYLFGTNGKKTAYSSNRKELLTNDLSGMYYTTRSLPSSFETAMTELGLTYKGADLPWYLLPYYFLFTNLRSLAIWTLFFVFALLLFAVKLMYAKKSMILRSLGLFEHYSRRELLQDLLLMGASFAVSILLFILYQGSISNIFVKSFTLLILTNAVILLLLMLAVHALFFINIRSLKALAILKNKRATPLVLFVWLVGICLSSVIFGLSLHKSLETIGKSANDIQVLGKWDTAKDFAEITWLETLSAHTDDNHQIDSDYFKEENQRYQHFLLSFSDSEVIYSEPSSLNETNLQSAPDDFKKELKTNGVDPRIASKVRYVNQGFMLKNKDIFPNNDYGRPAADAAGVIYIPKHMMGDADSILNIVNYEWFQYSSLKANQLVVQEVPNGQKSFLFNHKQDQQDIFAQQEEVDTILVQLNFSFMTEPSLLTKFGEMAQKSIYRQALIRDRLTQAGLMNVSGLTNVSNHLILERHKILSQLIGSVIALTVLAIAQCFIIYEYIVSLMKQKAKKISVWSLMGQKSLVLIGRLLLPLALCLFLAIGMMGILTGNSLMVLGIGLLYLGEIVCMSFFAYQAILKHRIQIIKGDFDIL